MELPDTGYPVLKKLDIGYTAEVNILPVDIRPNPNSPLAGMVKIEYTYENILES